MHQKSTLPAAEVTVAPERARVADRQPVGLIEPQLSPQAQGAESADTYQADRALHAMLARLTGGISPAALLLA
jgi:polyhydroxyalkanoate synthase